jgi:hypothetical protein
MKYLFENTDKLFKRIKRYSERGEVDKLVRLLEHYVIKSILYLNQDLKIFSLLYRIIASVNWLMKKGEVRIRRVAGEIRDLKSLLECFRDEGIILGVANAFGIYDKLINLLDEIKAKIDEKLNEELTLKDKLLKEFFENDNIIREKVKTEEERWKKGWITIDDIQLLSFLGTLKVLSEEERDSILNTKISTQYFQVLKGELKEIENFLYSAFYDKSGTH